MNRREIGLIMLYWIGVATILVGQFLYRYAEATVATLEAQLATLKPGQPEYYAIEGSLKWWRTETLTIYGPISLVLLWGGIATIVFVIVFGTWTILQERKTTKIVA